MVAVGDVVARDLNRLAIGSWMETKRKLRALARPDDSAVGNQSVG